MEIYAVCNWTISPFNNDFNKGLDVEEQQDHVFLIVPKAGASVTVLNTKTDRDSFLLCSFPLKAIQTMIPHKKITFIADIAGKEQFEMILNKIIINEDIDGKLVKTKNNTTVGGKPIYDSEIPIKVNNLRGKAFDIFIDTLSAGDLIKINGTISKDPLSCP